MTKTFSLFEVVGIEIESMVVDAETFDVKPVVDELLRDASGGDEWIEDVDDGAIGWSNELVTHVVELKTAQPARHWEGLAAHFAASAHRLDALARKHGARLMPGAMHPWMDPARETTIWPHETGVIYGEYDRLFDCRRHGWSNLQSVHLNLPFHGEDEFARLMAAVRIVLPLIPALAAASPFVEGKVSGSLDSRLGYYCDNARRTPAMTGDVIPEALWTFADYREHVFAPIDRDLEAIGAGPVLMGQEWTNARGAIARFDRMAIEIRLIDAQEWSGADLAIAAAVTAVVRALVDERWSSRATQQQCPSDLLVAQLHEAIARGPAAHVDGRLTDLMGARATTLGDLWKHLIDATFDGPDELAPSLDVILARGTLAERMLAATGPTPDRAALRHMAAELCACLAESRAFSP